MRAFANQAVKIATVPCSAAYLAASAVAITDARSAGSGISRWVSASYFSADGKPARGRRAPGGDGLEHG